jgi:hypothetical protein
VFDTPERATAAEQRYQHASRAGQTPSTDLTRRMPLAGHSVAVAMQDGDKERRLAEVIRVRCGLPAEGASEQGTPAHGTL